MINVSNHFDKPTVRDVIRLIEERIGHYREENDDPNLDLQRTSFIRGKISEDLDLIDLLSQKLEQD